jgi:hypothetical protein
MALAETQTNSLAATLAADWQVRLAADCPKQTSATHASVIQWLIGEHPDRLDDLDHRELLLAKQAMDYRYRILLERYIGVAPQQTYKRLMQRLGSLFLIRSKVKTWVAQSRDRQRSVMDVLGEVIQDMLQSDRHLQQQMAWIGKCTPSAQLRNTLILTSLEEYCLRPIRNQPLLVYRFVNYLNRSQRGGLTNVPAGEMVRMLSEEIAPDADDAPLSLLDNQALRHYQEQEDFEQLQRQRIDVQREFEAYLYDEVEPLAVDWLKLYLQGQTQDQIAQNLGVPIKQIYRLREKVSYHAVQVFSLKVQPDLVMDWLGTSLQEHNLGLNPTQWETFCATLSPSELQLIQAFQDTPSPEAVADRLGGKKSQVVRDWGKLYLAAQALRNT